MIRGEKIVLRALETTDAELMQTWINDQKVTRWMGGSGLLSLRDEQRWLEAEHKGELLLGIQTTEGCLIGSCSLGPLDRPHQCAELGICIGAKEYWNGGYGTDAVLTLCGYGFAQCNLHRIFLRVFSGNARGIRCYEKCGFVHEGCARQAFYKHGQYQDILSMGLLRQEYQEKWSERWSVLTSFPPQE